jgi:DNA-binding response OmpR family regulator
VVSGEVVLLLVEDEPLIALAMQDALEDAGYRVLIAEDGHSGSAALQERIQEVSGLITDIRLGNGPDGWRLARQARADRPQLPILYVTGDSAHEWSSQGVPGSAILQKPFLPKRMLAELREILP